MVAEMRTLGRAPKAKLKVRGVVHATREFAGERLSMLKNLYAELKQLKSQGITMVGVEFSPIESDRSKLLDNVGRYWRGAGLLLKRLDMYGVYIDDPQAFRLQEILSEGRYSKIAKYLPPDFDLLQLTRAVSYYRSLAMARNARRMGLKAIIIGGRHAEHLKKTNREVEYLYNTRGKPQTDPTEVVAFQQYKRVIVRILADMKSGKLRFD